MKNSVIMVCQEITGDFESVILNLIGYLFIASVRNLWNYFCFGQGHIQIYFSIISMKSIKVKIHVKIKFYMDFYIK